jgi:hypothetical protein
MRPHPAMNKSGYAKPKVASTGMLRLCGKLSTEDTPPYNALRLNSPSLMTAVSSHAMAIGGRRLAAGLVHLLPRGGGE